MRSLALVVFAVLAAASLLAVGILLGVADLTALPALAGAEDAGRRRAMLAGLVALMALGSVALAFD